MTGVNIAILDLLNKSNKLLIKSKSISSCK